MTYCPKCGWVHYPEAACPLTSTVAARVATVEQARLLASELCACGASLDACDCEASDDA